MPGMTPHPASSAPELLEQRPEARAFKVEDLMQEVQRGRLRIPSFQRRLAWDRHDARKLIDSLYRGYPVGTLLLWETQAKAQKWHWGSLALDAPARPDALLVVDGQQRLVSMARVLLTSDSDVDDFGLHFDLDAGEFVFTALADAAGSDQARWLPMNRLLDSERLFSWLYDKAPEKARRERALQLGKRIREYDIPAYIVRQGSEDVLREIFGRLNTRGKQLEAAEVFDALNGTRTGQQPASLADMTHVLAQSLDFGQVEQKILYRLLRVLQGQDVSGRRRDEPLRLEQSQADALYIKTEAVTRRVIHFMRHDAKFPHYDLLPYKQPIITLGKFFFHHAQPGPRTIELLTRWLWRGALNGAHRGDTVSTRTALARIDPGSEDRSVQEMMAMVGRARPNLPEALERFSFQFAASKLQALALLELQPRDLETGELLDIVALLNGRAANSDPPFIKVVAGAGAKNGPVFALANRLAHPPRLGLRRLLLRVTNPDILASHGISPAAQAALRAGDAVQFLRMRAETLQPHTERVFAGHARWSASDRPAIDALVVPEEAGASLP
jgi:hypothetical protein